MEINKIYNGDALEVLHTFPDESINCVMTSPPYWALRNYGIEGQIGLEPTFSDYINKICNIFDEVKRVLRRDGTCWVNIGDTYGGSGNSSGHTEKTKNLGYTTSQMGASKGNQKATKGMEKSLCNIPARFSIEMQNRGWILRNVIIWHKPNCMPSSVKDRFTVDFEYLFFFVKNRRYWFETQYDNAKEESADRYKYEFYQSGKMADKRRHPDGNCNTAGMKDFNGKRNKRTVWTITTQPFSEAHFATFPPELCETPIKSGCPEFVCNKCGEPRKEIIESSGTPKDDNRKKTQAGNHYKVCSGDALLKYKKENPDRFLGYTNCGCNTSFSSGIVLDPFCGAGTALLVSKRLGRNYVGIDLNPEYCKIAEDSIKSDREAFTMSVLKEIRKGKQKLLNDDGGTNFTKSSADDFPYQESLISVKRESADSPNLPQSDNKKLEEANFS